MNAPGYKRADPRAWAAGGAHGDTAPGLRGGACDDVEEPSEGLPAGDHHPARRMGGAPRALGVGRWGEGGFEREVWGHLGGLRGRRVGGGGCVGSCGGWWVGGWGVYVHRVFQGGPKYAPKSRFFGGVRIRGAPGSVTTGLRSVRRAVSRMGIGRCIPRLRVGRGGGGGGPKVTVGRVGRRQRGAGGAEVSDSETARDQFPGGKKKATVSNS